MNILEQRQNLKKKLEKSSNIYIMAHNHLDLDAISSCIAFSYYLNKINKKSYIIIDEVKHEEGVKKTLERLNEIKYINIIKSKEVKIDNDTVLVLLDTNKQKLLQAPELVNKIDNVINIDHHDYRRDSMKVSLSIIDDNASSTCEMLTSLFIKEGIEINDKIATLLLAGIVLDTNYFQLKATKDTFYYSYILMDNGGSMILINDLLKQDINDYIKRQKIIGSVKRYHGIAIGKGTNRNIYERSELAKTADMLLTFKNIKASFAIGKINKNQIGISGRSNGELHVGKILESFGGGGDENEAAAVIEKREITEVYKDLIKLLK